MKKFIFGDEGLKTKYAREVMAMRINRKYQSFFRGGLSGGFQLTPIERNFALSVSFRHIGNGVTYTEPCT